MLVEVAHEGVEVIIDSKLILQIVSHISYQEAVTLLDKGDIVWVEIRLSINLDFDKEEGYLCDVEVSHELLRLLIHFNCFHAE